MEVNNKTYFDVNLERSEVFRKVFCTPNLDVFEIDKLYHFCSTNVDFIDLADYLYSTKRTDYNSFFLNNLKNSFLLSLKESKLFNNMELHFIKNALNKATINPYLIVISNVDETIRRSEMLLNTDGNTLH